jgi:hypothetical protein
MAGGIVTTSSFARALWPGINTWYGMDYNDYPVEYTAIFDVKKSRKAFEDVQGLSGFGLAQIKPEGSSINYDAPSQAFLTRYQHTVFALGFIITREIYEDDQYDIIGQLKARALARSMRQTKEINGANIYNRAFNASYTYGDGSAILVNNHARFSSAGTYSNVLATPADLSEAALEQASIDIAGFTDDRGLLIAAKPEALIIPRQLVFEANRILKSDLRVGTNNNDINAIKQMGLIPRVIMNHYLTDPDAWFIKTSIPNGMTYFERRGDEFGMEEDFDTENAKYKATSRYSFGISDPRGLYGSPGA